MEPFSKDDPLHHLLGKGRSVEPRPNFTQNVLRAIRQEPQRQSLWERFREWVSAPGMGTLGMYRGVLAAVAVVALTLVVWRQTGIPGTSQVIVNADSSPPVQTSGPASGDMASAAAQEVPVEAVAVSQLEDLDQLSALLAQQDTSAISDSDIASLLY